MSHKDVVHIIRHVYVLKYYCSVITGAVVYEDILPINTGTILPVY